MRPLRAEFAPRFQVGTRAWAAIALMALAAAAGLLWDVLEHRGKYREMVDAANRLAAQLQAQSTGSQLQGPQPDPAPAYAADALAAASVAAFDVAGALSRLESVRLPGVLVVAVEVSATERQVRVDLELRDPALSLRYLEALNRDTERPRWQLVRSEAAPGSATSQATVQGRWE
jgi:hypothetical protein